MLNPYQLVPTGKGYGFTTSYEVTYEVYFTDITPTFSGVNVKVYSFGFECVSAQQFSSTKNLPTDPRVGETIAFILNDFFIHNRDIIVYVPMDTDKRAKLRSRLFDIWWLRFRSRMNCGEIEKDQYTLKYPGDEFTATMIYRLECRSEAKAVIEILESFNNEQK